MQRESNGENVVLQLDFSENASLQNQDAVQACHWHHGQATIFTACAWTDNENDKSESMVVVSDDLQHSKIGVYSYVTYILNHLKENYPSIKCIDVFYDGASSQFKQKYLFSNLHLWEDNLCIRVKWNFFATSHGKGVVDGIGGTVKRSVWRFVKSGNAQVKTPHDFYLVACQRNPKIHVKYISKFENELNRNMLEEHWQGTKTVPNTQHMHFVMPVGQHFIMVGETSDNSLFCHSKVQIRDVPVDAASGADTSMNIDQIPTNIDTDDIFSNFKSSISLEIGVWVVVNYEGQKYPGEITETTNSAVKVSVMHPGIREHWKWPNPKDEIYYKFKDIVKNIGPPEVVNNRGEFHFGCQF